MNSPTTLLPPNKIEDRRRGDCDIGLAVLGFPGGSNHFAAILLGGSLRQALRDAGIAWLSWGQLNLPTHIVIIVTVATRDPALVILTKHLEALGVLNFSQVAWFDGAENYWRNHHRKEVLPFDRFLTSEAVESAQQYAQQFDNIATFAKAFLEFFGRAKPGGDPGNPT